MRCKWFPKCSSLEYPSTLGTLGHSSQLSLYQLLSSNMISDQILRTRLLDLDLEWKLRQ